MAQHKHNWRFVRINPPMPQMGGAIAMGATQWVCTGCSATEIRPGSQGMKLVGIGNSDSDNTSLSPSESIPSPSSTRSALALRTVTLLVGYINNQGVNDAVAINPKTDLPNGGKLSRAQLATEARAAWQAIQGITPLWVDGNPATLVADIAAALGLSQGEPDGWFDPPPDVVAG